MLLGAAGMAALRSAGFDPRREGILERGAGRAPRNGFDPREPGG